MGDDKTLAPPAAQDRAASLRPQPPTASSQSGIAGAGMLYEIINPSDPVTMIAPSFEAALLATVLVGTGKYAAQPIGHDGPEVPMFLFDSFEPWFAERYPGRELGEFLKEHRAETVAALRSFCTGKPHERELFDSALNAITEPAKRAAFLAEWDDRRRSSLNQIANRAHSWADSLEASGIEGEAEDPQGLHPEGESPAPEGGDAQ